MYKVQLEEHWRFYIVYDYHWADFQKTPIYVTNLMNIYNTEIFPDRKNIVEIKAKRHLLLVKVRITALICRKFTPDLLYYIEIFLYHISFK